MPNFIIIMFSLMTSVYEIIRQKRREEECDKPFAPANANKLLVLKKSKENKKKKNNEKSNPIVVLLF